MNEDSLPDTLYHYTDANAFMEIIRTGQLWASSVSYMNDSAEFTTGIECALSVVESRSAAGVGEGGKLFLDEFAVQLGHPPDNTFAASLSARGNQLSQWRAYCPVGGGFSIGFRTSALLACMSSDIEFGSCIYEEVEQTKIIAAEIDRNLREVVAWQPRHDWVPVSHRASSLARELRSKYLALFKHQGFVEEEEFRLVAQPAQGLQDKRWDVRPLRGVLVPFLRLKIGEPQEVITSVYVGPTKFDEATSLSTARHLLTRNYFDLSALRLESCGIPFRHL